MRVVRVDTLASRIDAVALARGQATALCWHAEEISYSALYERTLETAAGLSGCGISPGDRVAIGLPNGPDLIVATLATLRVGAVAVPLSPSYTADEASYIVNDAGARLVLTDRAQADLLGSVSLHSVERLLTNLPGGQVTEPGQPGGEAEAPALIVYTSGTTGRPKGAVLSHRALLTNLDAVAAAWRRTSQDRLLLTLPCFHLHGLGLGILGSLLVGSSIVLRSRFVAEEVPADIEAHRITLFFGVPTMYNRLVALPDEFLRDRDLSSMRLWVSGSAPLPAATFNRFETRFGHRLIERFGMTEGGFMLSVPCEGPRRPGVVGRPLPGIEARIADADAADAGLLRDVASGEEGELLIRGPNLFSGYWNRPDDTRRAFLSGFFRSGDLAVSEPDGMIRITGRRSVDIIKTRGFKVSAVEIENQLQAHPAVREVAVVGIPDPDQGERVVAAVTLSAGEYVSPEDLRAHARQHLAPYKVPAEVVFLDEIPKTGPGKFSKVRLIECLSR